MEHENSEIALQTRIHAGLYLLTIVDNLFQVTSAALSHRLQKTAIKLSIIKKIMPKCKKQSERVKKATGVRLLSGVEAPPLHFFDPI
jgi:hypothetical protein